MLSTPPVSWRKHHPAPPQTETAAASVLCVCTGPHLNEGSVPDLAVQRLHMWGQVHVQQEVILQKTTITYGLL